MRKPSSVRTVYLYLFALVGLAVLVIGGVRFIDMGLKAFVFTQAEEEQRFFSPQPPMPYPLEVVENLQDEEGLSEEQKAAIQRWLADYENWKEKSSNFDYLTARRHRDASLNLALILVGFPLYFFHWRIIKRELKKEEARIA